MEHAHEAEGAAGGPASGIDGQILAMWRALRSNPSLDARWAMQVIDRLLDQRPRQPSSRRELVAWAVQADPVTWRSSPSTSASSCWATCEAAASW